MSVLVLNASYEPLHVVPVRRAVVLLLKEKAQLVEQANSLLRSERASMPRPLVIRLVTYVHVPQRWKLPVSRRAILARDGHCCQYCGRSGRGAEMTVDHVVPRSLGGKGEWDNLVAACGPCNHRKGNRRPEDAGMALLAPPARPRYVAFVLLEDRAPAAHRKVWQKYVTHPAPA
jgi:5-methylcytosine-specific restriction endonuclease McrA